MDTKGVHYKSSSLLQTVEVFTKRKLYRSEKNEDYISSYQVNSHKIQNLIQPTPHTKIYYSNIFHDFVMNIFKLRNIILKIIKICEKPNWRLKSSLFTSTCVTTDEVKLLHNKYFISSSIPFQLWYSCIAIIFTTFFLFWATSILFRHYFTVSYHEENKIIDTK